MTCFIFMMSADQVSEQAVQRDTRHVQICTLGVLFGARLVRAAWLCPLSSEREGGDFRPYVESDPLEVPQSPIHVEPPAVRQPHFAGGVPSVLDRQNRWRAEGQPALPSVRVSGEDPALVSTPVELVERVGIVAKDERRPALAERKGANGVRPVGPKIIDADDVQTAYQRGLVSQHAGAAPSEFGRHAACHPGIRPVPAVVVIAQDGESLESTMRQVFQNATELIELGSAAPCLEGQDVSRDDRDVGPEIPDTPEAGHEIVIVNLGTHVQIADLHEHRTIKLLGESLHGELAPDDLGPVWFNAPRIAGRASPTETAETRDSPQKGAATHAHSDTALTPGMSGRARDRRGSESTCDGLPLLPARALLPVGHEAHAVRRCKPLDFARPAVDRPEARHEVTHSHPDVAGREDGDRARV